MHPALVDFDIHLDIIAMMKIYFYESGAGNSPLKKFIDKLPEKDQARFNEVFNEIEVHGSVRNFLSESCVMISHHVTRENSDGFYEHYQI